MADEIKNTELEKQQEQLEEKKRKEIVSWVNRVPPIYVLVSACLQILLMMYFKANSINTMNLWWTISANIAILYLMSRSIKDKSSQILTPSEAYLASIEEAKLRERQERLPPNWRIDFEVQDGLKIIDGKGENYSLACKLVDPLGITYPMQATVFAQGLMKGYVTFQLLGATLYGTERERVIYTFNDFEKHLMKQPGFSMKDYMLGRYGQR